MTTSSRQPSAISLRPAEGGRRKAAAPSTPRPSPVTHHHQHHDHDHLTEEEHARLHLAAVEAATVGSGEGRRVSKRSLVALGVSGGMAPCPDALAILLLAVGINQLAFGMLAIVAFSLGLAGVLVAFGLAIALAGPVWSRLGRATTGGAGRFHGLAGGWSPSARLPAPASSCCSVSACSGAPASARSGSAPVFSLGCLPSDWVTGMRTLSASLVVGPALARWPRTRRKEADALIDQLRADPHGARPGASGRQTPAQRLRPAGRESPLLVSAP
ncbi:MAG: sulfite exporter TauE/SafE family protein [Thermomicrobiales bacterium]